VSQHSGFPGWDLRRNRVNQCLLITVPQPTQRQWDSQIFAATWQVKICCTSLIIVSLQWIGEITHFSRLVISPEAPAKASRMRRRHVKSSGTGAKNITKSSA
jgi:hypothetical protein